MLWILNFVSLSIWFPKCLRIAPFILLYVCNLSSKSLLYSDIQYPKYLKYVTCSIMLSFITIFTLCMWFPHIAIDFVFVLDIDILYFIATMFWWCAIVCNSSSDVAIKIWCRMFISSFILRTVSFLTRSVRPILSVLLQHRIQNFPGISYLFPELSQFQHHTKLRYKYNTLWFLP